MTGNIKLRTSTDFNFEKYSFQILSEGKQIFELNKRNPDWSEKLEFGKHSFTVKNENESHEIDFIVSDEQNVFYYDIQKVWFTNSKKNWMLLVLTVFVSAIIIYLVVANNFEMHYYGLIPLMLVFLAGNKKTKVNEFRVKEIKVKI